MAHAIEKVEFIEESKRPFKIAERVTWDATAKVVQTYSQLCFAWGEITILELLLTTREVKWEFAAWMVQLWNELHTAWEKISILKQTLKNKDITTYFRVESK